VDAGISGGEEVTAYYDPLLAKILAHGETRADAIRRLRRALMSTILLGVTTNQRFLLGVLDHEAFADEKMSTRFLEEHPIESAPADDEWVIALVAAAVVRFRRDAAGGPGYWRNNPGQPAPYRFFAGDREIDVWLAPMPRAADAFTVRLSGREETFALTLDEFDPPDLALTWNRVRHKVVLAVEEEAWWAHTKSGTVRLSALPLLPEPRRAADAGSLRAPVPGRVAAVLVTPGQTINEGQTLVKLEAMKMEYTIRAATAGIVEAVHFAVGDQVQEGQVLASITERSQTTNVLK